jgi:type III pantothenate kinase
MIEKEKVVIVDAGNSRVKTALFDNGLISEIQRFNYSQAKAFQDFVRLHDSPKIFISSVLSNSDLKDFIHKTENITLLHPEMILPVDIKYGSKDTLGMDRLANACAIQSVKPDGNKVAIDLGTCIKFDFVDEKGIYHGGSISPGLNMRLKALHHFTGKLPLVEPKKGVNYLGRSSEESILAGVIEGMQGELNHFISRYLQDYQGLTFFVTGGDAKFFDFPLKNNIFANENLTLTGLYKIYLLNA